MAYLLTPHFAPIYQAPQCHPYGSCGPVSRSPYAYRFSRPQPRRPQYSSFNHFFSQVDELLSEIDRETQRQAQLEAHIEAQREAYRQRQQRKRALRARFAVSQNEQGWEVNGDFQGFDQDNISIEITDEHTMKIAGNTEWKLEKTQSETKQTEKQITPAISPPFEEAQEGKMDGITLNEPNAETATIGFTTPESDTESHKSYQATVEDDFEDLGAETSSLVSASSEESSTVATPAETKGKERVNQEPISAESAEPQQQENLSQEQDRVHGSFERTFRFPERIDAANVIASFREGVLKITVPKAPVLQTRRIAIL